MVLDKTKNNRTLALTIFKKLFDELPQQLDGIAYSLKTGDYDNAKEITHKMHGSVSFCGLTDMQEPAKKLEQGLISRNHQTIAVDWLQLQEKVFKFIHHRKSILADLAENAN